MSLAPRGAHLVPAAAASLSGELSLIANVLRISQGQSLQRLDMLSVTPSSPSLIQEVDPAQDITQTNSKCISRADCPAEPLSELEYLGSKWRELEHSFR